MELGLLAVMTKYSFFHIKYNVCNSVFKTSYMQKHIQEDAKSLKKTHRFYALKSFQVFLIKDLKVERS